MAPATPSSTPKKLYKPAQTAMPTAGKNYLIYLNVGTDETTNAEWLILGGQRSGDVSRKADAIDASSKDSGGWEGTNPGQKKRAIDPETLLLSNEKRLVFLEKKFLNDEKNQFKF